MKIITSLLAVLCLTGCGTLSSTGPYHGDQTLYVADTTITTSYSIFDAFLKFEMVNRRTLQATPAVSKLANDIRLHARDWFTTAEALRDAYASAPTKSNAAALQQALAVIQAALTQATKYLITQPTS